MKKTLLAVLAIGTLAAVGCKKDDNPATPNNSGPSLLGDWKMTSYAYDENGDKVMQSSEQKTPAADEYGYLFVGNQNVTDSYRIDPVRVTATYNYTRQQDSVFTSFLGEKELVFVIQKLTDNTLEIMEPDATETMWRSYSRQ